MTQVKLTTNFGDIVIELDAEKAPITVANFLEYVKAGHYENVVFHRVIKGFMIQGGGFQPGMQEKKDKRASIQNEADNGLKNEKYTLAMARTMDPHSASAQFFINATNNSFLNHTAKTAQGWGYAVFGKVVAGTDVVDKIEGVSTTSKSGHQDVPADDVIIEKAEIIEAWIGDDAMTPFQRSICQALRELSDSGTAIFLMHGNRDFLLGKAFCKEAGCTLLKDPSVVQFYGEPVLLMHGDSLCTRDEAYMKLRRYLRNPITLFILRHLPLSTRHKLARKLRSESRAQTRMKANDIVDVTPQEIPRILQEYGVKTLIHGHTHRPAIHKLQLGEQAAKRIVLGDWDRQGWALQVDESGYALAPFDFAPPPALPAPSA
jgi:UDP-2,3-diacylglucosamine hydrolase